MAQSPWMRMSVANPHIGKSALSGSISIWIHLSALARLAYCGTNGTSESRIRPRSACSSRGSGSEPAKQGESWGMLRSIELNSTTRIPQAARQPVQHRDGLRPAAEIGRERHRIVCRHQGCSDRLGARRLDAARLHAAIARRRIRRHRCVVPLFRQRLARQHHVDRAGRIALRKGAGARQRLLHHHA